MNPEERLAYYQRAVLTKHALFDELRLSLEPEPPPITQDEMDYVYQSLGVKPARPKPCGHGIQVPVSKTMMRCDLCDKMIPTPVGNQRRRR